MVFLSYTSFIMVLLLLLHGRLSFTPVHAHQGNEESDSLKNSIRKSLNGLHNQVQVTSNTLSAKSKGSTKGEIERLNDEAKEIMKLMSKDYGRKWSPKRKPPINNKIPMH